MVDTRWAVLANLHRIALAILAPQELDPQHSSTSQAGRQQDMTGRKLWEWPWHSVSRHSASPSNLQPSDPGTRWRINAVGSGRFMYAQDSSVIGSTAFFSLFKFLKQQDGSYTIAESGGKWLHAQNTTQLSLVANSSGATRFWLRLRSGAHELLLEEAGSALVCQHPQRSHRLQIVTQKHGRDVHQRRCLFQLQCVVAPEAGRNSSTMNPAVESTFKRRVARSTTRAVGRSFVLVTYHNIGMIDWATLFWGWLIRSGIRRFMLLELDSFTCGAARALNETIEFECVRGDDLKLPETYTHIKHADNMLEWGTHAESGYFKILRWKLRVVELIIMQNVDVLMADVDVLVLSPNFVTILAGSNFDLTISSDARQGSYNDNKMCPCSHPMYHKYAVDWVCAGLFYLRSSSASAWFMQTVQQIMDDFTITDQDAIQAVLTGHTQVAIPQMRLDAAAAGTHNMGNDKGGGNGVDGGDRPQSGPLYQASPAWLPPLWVQDLAPGSVLGTTLQLGMQPLNTPMKESRWKKCQSEQRRQGFTWTMVPLESFGNGPMLIDRWNATFRQAGNESHSFVSIHANCNTKARLAADTRGTSFLLHPDA